MPVEALAALAVIVLATSGSELVYRKVLGRRARVKRALARRPGTLVEHAEGALIRATGCVRATGGLLRAPVSGRPCVAYQVTVGSRQQQLWLTLFEFREARSFSVADESGPVFVNMAAPFVLSLASDIKGQAGWLAPHGEREEALFALIEGQGIPTRTWYGGRRTFWYNESALENGQTISVAGISIHDVHPDGERPDPRAAPERLLLYGTPDNPLLIGDEAAP
jgi:hypothetical protein